MNLFEVMTSEVARMSRVTRYSSFPVNRMENVAEHSFWVAFISYLIAFDLREQGHRIDLGMTLRGAITHDLSEIISGDVIRSYKHTNDDVRQAMKMADHINMDRVTQRDEWGATGDQTFSDWNNAKSGSTLEGQIVAFADMAAVVFYCREEDRSGNRAIREVLQEAYEDWFSTYHTHPELGKYIDQIFPSHLFSDALREETVPARVMYPGAARPIMADHSEGETSDHLDWHAGEVPLG